MRKVLIGLGLAGALGMAGLAGMAAAQQGGGPGGPPPQRGEGGPRGGWGQGGGWGGGGPPWMRGGEMRGGWRFRGNPAERQRMRLERTFQHFDRNLDGVVEWSEAQQVLGLTFARLDTDGDGAITRADIEARINRRFERFRRFAEGRGMPDRPGFAERRAQMTTRAVERFMGRFGKGADGRVTREEFVAQFEPIYRMINRTGDGRVTMQQVREFFAFMRMLRG
jgi:Ca2+-binding EF-hand superfamily protein